MVQDGCPRLSSLKIFGCAEIEESVIQALCERRPFVEVVHSPPLAVCPTRPNKK
jgi:hypothetical protein